MPASQTLLGIFAHPDDEVFAAGGVIARSIAHGIKVVLACVTRGEEGEISDPALATKANLAAVREAELRTAAAHLGVTDVRFLGFHDSGMAGTPQNDDERTLPRTDPTAATERFVALLRAVQPDIVITHDPTGGYGHPDHIAACHYTTLAFDAAGNAQRFPDAGAAWQPAGLFYNVIPKSFFQQLRQQMIDQGLDTSQWDSAGFAQRAVADEAITHRIDVRAYFVQKRAAFDAHRTQFGPDSPMRKLPEESQRATFGYEPFIQARPTPAADFKQQHNLWQNLVDQVK
jgi:LmbE family N-acetylglucosaminyl deacetylase